VGALLALMVTGQDLSVVALIGIELLMGIVKKNAIMMIDFALEAERRDGLSPRDSIVKASMLRFRPIMMTTLAALFGALPLALEPTAPRARPRPGPRPAFPAGPPHSGGSAADQPAPAVHAAGALPLQGPPARVAPPRGRPPAGAADRRPPPPRDHAASRRMTAA